MKKGQVTTPETIGERKTRRILKGAEVLLKFLKGHFERLSETDKDRIREFASSIPKKAWENRGAPYRLVQRREKGVGRD